MRQSMRGWRSARSAAARVSGAPAQVATAPAMLAYPMQEPLRFSLGLAALVFYLWIVHSYKLPVGDIAVIGMGIGVLLRGGKISVPAPLVVFGLLILWSLTGLAVTFEAPRTTLQLLLLAKLWVIAFCLFNLIRTAAELRFFVIVWLAVFALYPVRGALYNQYVCHCTEFGRVAWNFAFSNPNDLATLSMIPLGLAAGIASVERVKIWRYAGFIGVAVLSLTIMLTQSRGAMLAIGAATVLLIASSRNKARDLTLLVALMGVAALAAPRGVWERLAGLTNISVDQGMQGVDPEGSAESRWDIWMIAVDEIKRRPFTGLGLGMMPVANRLETLRRNERVTIRGERDTHSTYLRLAAETGFPGLLLYLALWGTILWKLRSVRRRIRETRPRDHQFLLFLEIAIISFSVAAIFGTYPYVASTYISAIAAWLAATILEREPWYVPPSQRAAAMDLAPSRF